MSAHGASRGYESKPEPSPGRGGRTVRFVQWRQLFLGDFRRLPHRTHPRRPARSHRFRHEEPPTIPSTRWDSPTARVRLTAREVLPPLPGLCDIRRSLSHGLRRGLSSVAATAAGRPRQSLMNPNGRFILRVASQGQFVGRFLIASCLLILQSLILQNHGGQNHQRQHPNRKTPCTNRAE